MTTDDQGTSESLEVAAANPDFQETSKSLEVAEIEMKGSLATKPPNLLAETSDTGFCEESGSVQMEPPRKKGKFQNLQEKIMHIWWKTILLVNAIHLFYFIVEGFSDNKVWK